MARQLTIEELPAIVVKHSDLRTRLREKY